MNRRRLLALLGIAPIAAVPAVKAIARDIAYYHPNARLDTTHCSGFRRPAGLSERGVPTPRRGFWSAAQVMRVLARGPASSRPFDGASAAM
jgi:hypothetical protein